jgi:hypothetical protein
LHFTVGFPNRVQVDVVSDANGRYEAAGFSDGISILLSVFPDQNHRAPSPVPIALLKSNTILDLHVVSQATLITSGLPASLPTPSSLPHVLGTVFEIASGQPRHLRRSLVAFTEHYHRERNHQGLQDKLIMPTPADPLDGPIRCRPRLGGLLRYYYRAA